MKAGSPVPLLRVLLLDMSPTCSLQSQWVSCQSINLLWVKVPALTIFALIFGGVCMLRFSHAPLLRACNFWNIVSYFIVKIFNIVTVVRGQGVETKKEIWLTMASIKKKWKNVPMSLLHHKARWGHVSPGCGVWRVTVRRPRQWQYRSGASHYLTRHQPSISDYISHSHKYLVVMVDMVFQHLFAYVM